MCVCVCVSVCLSVCVSVCVAGVTCEADNDYSSGTPVSAFLTMRVNV